MDRKARSEQIEARSFVEGAVPPNDGQRNEQRRRRRGDASAGRGEERKGEGSVAPLPARVNAGKNGDSANVFRGCARSLFSDN